MTCYDSSVLIDYLDGVEEVVHYVEANLDERAVAPQLVLFEVYQGEIFRSGPADFDAVDGALEWLTAVDDATGFVRAGAELRAKLHDNGELLSARDAFISGAAIALGERLAVSDSDFDIPVLPDRLDVDIITTD